MPIFTHKGIGTLKSTMLEGQHRSVLLNKWQGSERQPSCPTSHSVDIQLLSHSVEGQASKCPLDRCCKAKDIQIKNCKERDMGSLKCSQSEWSEKVKSAHIHTAAVTAEEMHAFKFTCCKTISLDSRSHSGCCEHWRMDWVRHHGSNCRSRSRSS